MANAYSWYLSIFVTRNLFLTVDVVYDLRLKFVNFYA